MTIANNGDVNIYYNNVNDDYVEFQEINIYPNGDENELIYNGLNGKSLSLSELFYYYHENDNMFGEDENWYVYKNHR